MVKVLRADSRVCKAHTNNTLGGETIKSMQSETGCKINVSQASGADIEREIGLVGTRQAIDDAKRAIWEKVDQVVSLLKPRLFLTLC